MKPTKISRMGPCLLISMPQLQDPNFSQTTSLLSEFGQNGAMGFVLNRPLGASISHLMEDFKSKHVDQLDDLQAFWGGPIQNDRGFIIHEDTDLAKDSIRISEHLYISSTSEILIHLLEKQTEKQTEHQTLPNRSRFRLFLGYSGWGPKQLESEIAQSSWITAPLDENLIFDTPPNQIWKKSFENIGVDPNKLASSPQSEAN
ncbi:MAG: YqgE/AlgH family protein [Bdellovibrionales bacterium]|nr:YqgE/AlgH family protein [Bdellovibrionales bacterium]